MENLAAIQRTFYLLLGFVREMKDAYPNPPGIGGDWRINHDDNEQTFRLDLGESTRVYVESDADEYTIDFVYQHLNRRAIRVASRLPRTDAQAFLRQSMNSRYFNDKPPITTFHNEDDGAQEMILHLLEKCQVPA